jgi:hypothetical protein
MEKEITVMLIQIIMMDIIKMKMELGKNVMILVQNVQEKENHHVLNVLQDITLFIINLVFVLLINQMTVIMMKKMILIKNVMKNVVHVLKKEIQQIIIVFLVQLMQTEYMYIILFMINQDNVSLKVKKIMEII